MSRIVVALGGNALGNNSKEQIEIVKNTAKHLVDLVQMGNEVIITHGNGPQVGMIFNAMANVDPTTTEDDMPFAECGAMSQGYIGYHLQQAKCIPSFAETTINELPTLFLASPQKTNFLPLISPNSSKIVITSANI